jgi:hypothetical protein
MPWPFGGNRDAPPDPKHPPKNIAAEQMMQDSKASMHEEIGPHKVCDCPM